jgi:hypothetical protein
VIDAGARDGRRRAQRLNLGSRIGSHESRDLGLCNPGVTEVGGVGVDPTFSFQPSSGRSRAPARVDWCEIKRGRDFFAWTEPVDWIVTNPPWSQFRAFLQHAMTLAEKVVWPPVCSSV